MTGETLEKESAAVQIGHPITERKFATAIPALRDADCIRAITDLGAGGLSCAAGEMGAQTGVTLELDEVPLKDQSLTAWEILLSESQERMLVAIPANKLAQAKAILDRFEVGYAVVGTFSCSGRLVANWRGRKVADLEMSFLWGACPIDPVSLAKPQRRLKPLDIPHPRTADEWAEVFSRVLSHYHCADQSAAGARFDTTVQGRTAVGPFGGKNHRMPTNIYVSAPLYGKPYGVMTAIAFNPFYGEIDSAVMARLMVIEAITKAVVAGADYREMVLCDNSYTPRLRPEIAWDLKAMVEAIADFSIEIGVPFISGKDSSSGTFEAAGQTIEVPMTLAVASLSRLPHVGQIATKEFKRSGNRIVVVGKTDDAALGGSVYADTYGQRGDRLFDPGDATELRTVWDKLLRMRKTSGYVAGCAIAEGGVALRLFEACDGSGLGARVDIGAWKEAAGRVRSVSPRGDTQLFGEFVGSALLEVPSDFDLKAFLEDVPHCIIGEVTAEPQITLVEHGRQIWQESVPRLAECWRRTFREVIE